MAYVKRTFINSFHNRLAFSSTNLRSYFTMELVHFGLVESDTYCAR